jgi:amino acid adenylation domain-containing protein
METVTELLDKLAIKGVKLSSMSGQLKCYAPKGALTPDLQAGIARYKTEILALLAGANGAPEAQAVEQPLATATEFPLSAGQKGLYILQSLHPDMGAYNVPICVRINGPVDTGILAKAWSSVLDRFPILTARVIEKEGALVQRLDDDCRTTLQQRTVDFADEQAFLSFLRQQAKQPIDLNRGPLTRIDLFFREQQSPVLLLTVHHIVFDGLSAAIVMKSLLDFYQQWSAGNPVRLSSGLPGYQGFVAWEEAMLESAEGAAHARYWRQQLESDQPAVELPPDFPRMPSASFEGETRVEELPEDLSRTIGEFSKAHSLPPSVVFLGVFQLLLQRYANQEDIVVGMPVLGRAAQQFAEDVGYFINMVPVRAHCDGRKKMIDFLRTVRGGMLDALYHSSYPFPLMRNQSASGRREANPIFRVSYAYQNFFKPSDAEALLPQQQALQVEPVAGIWQEGEFDLGLEIFESGTSSFTIHVKYNPDLYAQRTIASMIERYRVLLRAVSENPNLLLHEYRILASDEEKRLLYDFNDTRAEYPGHQCVHQLFAAQAAEHPGRTAVVCGTRELTYRELHEASRDLALYLQSLGVGPDRLVGLCMERSVEMVVGLLAILQAGGAYVPLDPAYPEERLAYMLRDSGAAIVLTQETLRDRLAALVPADTRLVALDRQGAEIAERVTALKAESVELRQNVEPHHLAYVIYTSGSTGLPKGVMVEHRSVVNYLTYCVDHYMSDGSNLYGSFIHLPLTFDASVTSLFAPLLAGKAIDVDRNDAIDTFKDGAFLDRGYDFVKLTPAHLLVLRSNFDKLPAEYLGKKNVFVVGGEALTRDHVDFLNVPQGGSEIINEYGPTEATVGCTTSRFAVGGTAGTVGNITIGKPIANVQIYILDSYGHPQPAGIPGELHIAGDGLARGYLNRPELTEEKFVANPFVPGARMYKTGDLARWLDDGNIEYLGRIDTQVKIRGYRIETGEIEARLNQHAAIQESVVVAQGAGVNKQLVAFYRAKETMADQIAQLPGEELRAHLLRTLPEYMVPAAFASLAAIPLTSNGKVDRRALERRNVTAAASREYVAPRNATEAALVAICAEVLQRAPETIGVDHDFFELGGHSLLATQLISKIRTRLDVDLPLRTVFAGPTVAGLAQSIATAGKRRMPRIRPVDRSQFQVH